MTNTKEFPLNEILTVTTGILLCQIGRLYEILNFITGDNVYTHQIPRVMKEVRPFLLHQHPSLASVDYSLESPTEELVREWVEKQIVSFGASLPITRMSKDEHEYIDPVSELVEMVHPDKIVVVKPES